MARFANLPVQPFFVRSCDSQRFFEFCCCHEINLVLDEFSLFAERPLHTQRFPQLHLLCLIGVAAVNPLNWPRERACVRLTPGPSGRSSYARPDDSFWSLASSATTPMAWQLDPRQRDARSRRALSTVDRRLPNLPGLLSVSPARCLNVSAKTPAAVK